MSDDAAENRIALADEISGVAVGSGYESTTIGIDAAMEAADLILASDWLAEHDREVAAKALEDAAQAIVKWDHLFGPDAHEWLVGRAQDIRIKQHE